MRFRLLFLGCAAALAVIACRKRVETVDASTVVRVDATAPIDAGVVPAPVDDVPNLLDVVPAKVAVSSTVENPHDFPEFLVDGKLDTAWNGKSGDLVGGTISFRLPSDVRVKRIEMAAGYDRKNGGVDFFTANHRITSVEVSRDGTVVGTYSLDPNKRGVQPIAAAGPGGDWQIKVLDTLPGTHRSWKELVVSELRVVGTPGGERRDPKEPLRVVVGKLDQEPETLADESREAITEAYPTVAAYCAHLFAEVAADAANLQQQAHDNALTLHPPSCSQLSETPLGGAYKRAIVVKASHGIGEYRRVVVEVARGVVPLPVIWYTDDPLDPGCPSSVQIEGIRAIRVENGHVVVVVSASRQAMNEDGSWKTVSLTDVTWCKEGSGSLGCRTYGAAYRPLLQSFGISPAGELVRQSEKKNPLLE